MAADGNVGIKPAGCRLALKLHLAGLLEVENRGEKLNIWASPSGRNTPGRLSKGIDRMSIKEAIYRDA